MNGGGGISSGSVVIVVVVVVVRSGWGASRVWVRSEDGWAECVSSMTGFVFFAKPRVAAEARRDILWVA